MPPSQPLLSHDRMLALAGAARDADLDDPATQDALLNGIPKTFRSRLPIAGAPIVRLKNTLDVMNRTGRLSDPDRTLPLEVWLKNALDLLEDNPAGLLVQAALHDLARRERPLAGEIRLLFLGIRTAVKGQGSIDPIAAYNAIEQAIAPAGGAFQLRSGWDTQLPALQRHLHHVRPHVVHFHAHGDAEGRLKVAFDAERSLPVRPADLAALLGAAGEEVRLASFCVCHSAALAREAVSVVDFAVGMDGPVEEKAAVAFAGAFYAAAAAGRTVQRSFDEARAVMEGLGLGEGDKPVLVARAGEDPARAVLRPEG